MSKESSTEAVQRALRYLRYRARSERDIRTKLIQVGYGPKTVDRALERLRALDLVNDEQFARSWALARVERQGYGAVRIQKELLAKGLPASLIDRVVAEAVGPQQGKQRAQALLQKRFGGQDLANPKILSRAVGFLQRRGYRDSVITELLQPIPDDA